MKKITQLLKKPVPTGELSIQTQRLSAEIERLVDRLLATERQLDDAFKQLEVIYFHEGTLDVTADGTITAVNEYMLRLLGYTQEELIGKNIRVMSSGVHPREFWESFHRTIHAGKAWKGEIVNRKKDGTLIPLDTLVIPIVNPGGGMNFKVVRNHNLEFHTLKGSIQELLDANKKIDPLTGLPNREKCIDDCSVNQNRSATILHINNIRDINSVHGIPTGDGVLKKIGRMLGQYAQDHQAYGTRIYKLEGPDFLLLYEKPVSEEFIREQYQRIQNPELIDNKENIPLFFSLGIGRDETNIHVLLKKCFLALERAKDGRQAAIYDGSIDTTDGSETLLTMQALVSRAFAEDLFEVHGQKIAKNSSGNTEDHMYEVLVRMRDPDNPSKLISAGAFIDVIKQIGQGKELTTLIIDKTCVAMRNHPLMQCSINITEDDLRTPGRAESIHKQIIHNRIPSSRITFEILESIETLTPEILENIHLLKEAGFHIAIDDAGSGSSGLLRLTQFEADKVKIDMKLIRGIDKNSKHRAVVASLISLAHTLGMTVTAEGVETSEEWDTVIQLGADYIQGYINDNRPKPFSTI